MWNSQALKDHFSAQFAAASALVADCQAKLNDPRLVDAEAKVAQMLAAAQASVTSAQEALDDLAASGIYTIALTPGAGAWPGRLSNASGAPVNDGAMVTAIIASIFVAPTINSVESAYGSMKDAITKPMRIAKPTLPPITKAIQAPEGIPEWIDEDAWLSKTVGDIFPGQLVEAKSVMNVAQEALTLAQNAKNAFDAKKLELVDALAEAQGVVSSLSSTGVYSVLLPPEVGGWLTRLTSESNAPPMGSEFYTGGTVTVIQAADLSTVMSRWTSLVGAMQ